MRINKIAALILSAAMAMGSTALAANFEDTRNHWAEYTIDKLVSEGIVEGESETKFNPDGTVTRAEFLKMAMNTVGIPAVEFRNGECLEITENVWYSGYVQSALDKGLIPENMITAYKVRVESQVEDDGTVSSKVIYSGAFNPTLEITREEMAYIIQSLYQYTLNASTMKKLEASDKKLSFSDAYDISDWAVTGVKIAVAQGFVEGMEDGTFKPQDTATRAQAATIVSRVLDHKNIE